MVTDSITGLPLQARVEIIGHDVDSSHVYSRAVVGNYHRYLSAGNYQVSFSKNGYYNKTIDVNVVDDQVVIHDVQLVPVNTVLIKDINEGELKIINTFDILGRKTPLQWNSIYLQQMSDGTVQKLMKIK